jgi:hypothetical protein
MRLQPSGAQRQQQRQAHAADREHAGELDEGVAEVEVREGVRHQGVREQPECGEQGDAREQ